MNNKPIVFIDIEATGLNITTDRIVEIACVKWLSQEGPIHLLINPGIPIPPEVVEVHGITDETVKGCHPFSHYAASIHDFINGCDIGGYNCRNFDVPLLWEELYRCNIVWDMTDAAIIDAGNIFKLQHPRDLTAAVRLYCQRKHEYAHSALADVEATIDVFDCQCIAHPDVRGMTRQQLNEYCQMGERRVDLCGTIVLNDQGVPVFNTKRNKGVPVVDDPGYAQWFLRNDFPQSTKLAIEKILNS